MKSSEHIKTYKRTNLEKTMQIEWATKLNKDGDHVKKR